MASLTYKVVASAAEQFFQTSRALGPSSSKNNKDIVTALRKMISDGKLDVDVTDGTILSYLSQAANNDSESGIVSGEPHAGYWYDSSAKAPPETKPVDEEKIKQAKGGLVTIR